MAVAHIPPLVPVDEYLNSGYHPEMEYVDGVLVERGMPTIAHGFLQMILIQYFAAFQVAFGFRPIPEVRTQIVARARYRVPDLVLCPFPVHEAKVITTVPWAVIEILSPTDRLPDQLQRFAEYRQIGIRHLVLLDPERYEAFRVEERSLLFEQFTSLDLPTGQLPFDTEAIFEELRESLTGHVSA